jgi:hypothetical protein
MQAQACAENRKENGSVFDLKKQYRKHMKKESRYNENK